MQTDQRSQAEQVGYNMYGTLHVFCLLNQTTYSIYVFEGLDWKFKQTFLLVSAVTVLIKHTSYIHIKAE